jgi:hypothetical protein
MPEPGPSPKAEDSPASFSKAALFGFYPQLLAGLLLGGLIELVIGAFALKYPSEGGLAFWIGVFAFFWICIFLIMRKRWGGVLVGLVIGAAIAYYIITRVFSLGAFG